MLLAAALPPAATFFLGLLLLACALLFLSAKLLFTRRPLILSSRWSLCALLAPFLASIAQSASQARTPLVLLAALSILAVTVTFWYRLAGASLLLAVTETTLRDALRSSAATLGYTLDQGRSHIRIVETRDEIRLTFDHHLALARFKPFQHKSASLAIRLLAGTRPFLHPHPHARTSLAWALFLIFVGGLILSIDIPRLGKLLEFH